VLKAAITVVYINSDDQRLKNSLDVMTVLTVLLVFAVIYCAKVVPSFIMETA